MYTKRQAVISKCLFIFCCQSFILIVSWIIVLHGLSWAEALYSDEEAGKGDCSLNKGFDSESCRVTISFYLHHQPRMASNQVAVWIENADGDYVATVFVTLYTAGGGYDKRPLSLPLWREVSGFEHEQSQRVDAVSRATPLSGTHSAVWDCRDEHGQPVPSGRYIYRVEGNIFWENRVVWTGEIMLGPLPDQSNAKSEYIPERAHRKGILLEDVRAEYDPGGQ